MLTDVSEQKSKQGVRRMYGSMYEDGMVRIHGRAKMSDDSGARTCALVRAGFF
jgi:hypothetical protein